MQSFWLCTWWFHCRVQNSKIRGRKQVAGGSAGKKRRCTAIYLNYDEAGGSDSETPSSSATALSMQSAPAKLTPGLKAKKSVQLIILTKFVRHNGINPGYF